MSSLGDIRFALRALARSRGFTAVAVLCLALGIGASSAIFTIVDRTLLRPLPYRDPGQLVAINSRFEALDLPHFDLSLLEVGDLRQRTRSLTSVSAYGVIDANVAFHPGASPERAVAVVTDTNTFVTLGVGPALGRDFRAEEGVVGNELVVVLGHDLWQEVYGGDPEVIGRTVVIDTEPHVVIGVMPPGFHFPLRPDVGLFAPLAFRAELDSTRAKRSYGVLARRADGVTMAELERELADIAAQMRAENPAFYASSIGFGLTATRLDEVVYGSVRPAMIALLGAVALVLLIACANVAGLLLARGVTRERELALRAALGASRWRLVRQLFTESLVLAGLGAAAGLLGALWATDLLISLYPDNLPRLAAIAVDRSVLGFAIACAVAAGLVAGSLPAVQLSKVDLHSAIEEGGSRSTVGRRRRRLRNAMVAGEIALAMVLLVGAGLMMRTLDALQSADLGFRGDQLITMKYKLPWTDYMEDEEARRDFHRDLLGRVARISAAHAVAITSAAPFEPYAEYVSAKVAGVEYEDGDHPPAIQLRTVSPGYFAMMGVELIAGREFTAEDDEPKKVVAVVDEVFARYVPAGTDPVGAEISFPTADGTERRVPIVGVVRHVRYEGVAGREYPQVYLPILVHTPLQATLIVSSDVCVGALAGAVQRELNQLDARIPVYQAQTMSDRVAAAVALPRFASLLLGLFAGLALLLASIGVYAVMSYSVTQRRREIGIRLALGARPGQVVGMILGQGATITLIGLALGLLAAAGVALSARGLLYQTSPFDPTIYSIAAITVAGAALLACALAARRAARIDPMDALRSE